MVKKTIKSPYKAIDVANYLIYLASEKDQEGGREGITHLKLQKLLYFAQAYYLSKIGKPLFSENLEAWDYGPVVRELYRKMKSNGSNPIIEENDKSSLSGEDKIIIKRIWDVFGSYSASKLVDIVHSHTPWKEANTSKNKIISHKSMKDYYGSLINK